MNGSTLELKADGSIAKLIVNGQDISNMSAGIDIKIRAGNFPEATVYLADPKIDMTINSYLIKKKKPNAMRRLSILNVLALPITDVVTIFFTH